MGEQQSNVLSVDAFVEALGDAAMEVRVSDKDPRMLDEAYKVALNM